MAIHCGRYFASTVLIVLLVAGVANATYYPEDPDSDHCQHWCYNSANDTTFHFEYTYLTDSWTAVELMSGHVSYAGTDQCSGSTSDSNDAQYCMPASFEDTNYDVLKFGAMGVLCALFFVSGLIRAVT